jgi:hypothetical protein
MDRYDTELNDFANNGLRTAEDWLTHRREVADNVSPCFSTMHRGLTVALYSRTQTRLRAKSQRPHRPDAA